MWESKDNDSLSSHQKNESNKEGLLTFQKHYVDDYIADKERRLEKDNKKEKLISIHFKFQESSLIPGIDIYELLQLYNLQQFESTLHHYHDRSNTLYTITNHSKYEDLQGETDRRKTSQFNIDKRIKKLSQYLTFTFVNSSGEYNMIFTDKFNIVYTNLNRSTLPLAVRHLQSILLVFKTWIYQDSDSDEINKFITKISKQYDDRLSYQLFQNHYIDSLLYTQLKSPLIMLRINLEFELNNTKHCLNKTLHIRNIEQFKTILRTYDDGVWQYFTPLKSSSRYKDLYIDITYRNTLQVRLEKVLELFNCLFNFNIKEDEYDPLTLNLYYYLETKSFPSFIIRHLELLILTFKTWNDDENDKNTLDLYLLGVKDELLPLLKNQSFKLSFKSLWNYYPYYCFLQDIFTLHINLHIILKEYQRTITKTLQLQDPIDFINLLNYYQYLPNGYLPLSNSFDTSLSNLLYIFDFALSNEDQDKKSDEDLDKDLDDLNLYYYYPLSEYNPSTLNLYYYPLSNKLDTSLIIKHLTLMICSFKDLEDNEPNDIFEIYQCLSSIAVELNSLSNPRLSLPKLHLPQPSPFDPSLFNPSLTKNSTQSPSLPSNPFWYPYNPTDPNNTPPSPLTLYLRLLSFNNLTLKDTLHFQDTSRFLSILDHYNLKPNTFDHLNTNDFKVSNSIKIQKDTDSILLNLSRNILFSYEKASDDTTFHLTYSNLKSIDIPSAILHLELMVKVFKTWSYDRQGGKVLNGFVGKARSTIIPNINYNDDGDKVTGSSMITTLPIGRDHPTVLGPLIPMDPSGPAEVRASDGNLGGASVNFPNLLEVSGGDISMMEDVD